MAIYVMGDIHGQYDLFMDLLSKLSLKETDILYTIGDILDRGPHPVKVLEKMMEMPNLIPLIGNHEVMAMECLSFLLQDITDESVASIDEVALGNLLHWQRNGCETTLKEFAAVPREKRLELVDYIREFTLYEEVAVGGDRYLLVHGGLGNFSEDKPLDEYTLTEIVWTRPNYTVPYFDDRFVVTGHTPTQLIRSNPRPGYIYRANGHIAIDCGACFTGGRLAAICLDTGEEYYSKTQED